MISKLISIFEKNDYRNATEILNIKISNIIVIMNYKNE